MWEEELNSFKPALLPELQEFLRINTEYQAATACAQAPCGKGVAEGLDFIRQKAKADGFDVLEFDERALAVTCGEGSARVEAVSHLDVVPAGGGWDFPPYGAVVKDGRLYGRGAQDMKAALWATYTALRMIRLRGVPLRRQIRIVVGTDEERTMQDISYYLTKAGLPDFAFTPDSRFPVCMGEKGVLVLYLNREIESAVRSFKAGTASNVICSQAEFTVAREHAVAFKEVLAQTSFQHSLAEEKDTVTVRVYGKAAHSSLPQLGSSAIVGALTAIDTVLSESWAHELLCALGDPFGAGLGFRADYPPMGCISTCLNILRIDGRTLHGELDIRYPDALKAASAEKAVSNALVNYQVTSVYEEPAIRADFKNPFVQSLLNTYKSFYPQDDTQPYYSGGVSYAKAYGGRCVAYGSRLPFGPTPHLAHQKNEYILVEHVYDLCRVYAQALTNLSNCEGVVKS